MKAHRRIVWIISFLIAPIWFFPGVAGAPSLGCRLIYIWSWITNTTWLFKCACWRLVPKRQYDRAQRPPSGQQDTMVSTRCLVMWAQHGCDMAITAWEQGEIILIVRGTERYKGGGSIVWSKETITEAPIMTSASPRTRGGPCRELS